MKILHVLSDINIESGGVAAAACGMAEAIAARGHDVAIACLNRGGTTLQPLHVTLHRFPADSNAALLPSKALRKYLFENMQRFDIVHVHGVWQHPCHYASATARSLKIPYILAPHGMLDANSLAMGRRWAKSAAWFLWDSTMVNGAAAIHCLNEAEIRCSPALRNTRNAVIGNGVPNTVLDNLPARGLWRQDKKAVLGDVNRPIALFLSRIHLKKGLERLLPYWPELLKAHPDLLLVIAGTGEAVHVAQVKDVVQQHGLANSVFFAGQLSGTAKWQALVDADAFILPSYQEGFSMAITEAMAAGLPVVITSECNFNAVEQYHAGISVRDGDMKAFVCQVAALLSNPGARHSLGHNGQKLVREQFTWEATAEKLEGLYKALVARDHIPSGIPLGSD